MTEKETLPDTHTIATPNNIKFFEAIFLSFPKDTLQDILSLLEKRPEPGEMIAHYIEKKEFDFARAIAGRFFLKKEDAEPQEYYIQICAKVFTVLKEQVSEVVTNDKEYGEIYIRDKNMLTQICSLGDDIEKERFYMGLNDLCRDILEMNTLFADEIVFFLWHHFGCKEGFSLMLPASIIKQKIYGTPFKTKTKPKYGPDYDNDRWKTLQDTDLVSLSLDEKGYARIDNSPNVKTI